MVRDIFNRYEFLVSKWRVANARKRSTVPPLMIILSEAVGEAVAHKY